MATTVMQAARRILRNRIAVSFFCGRFLPAAWSAAEARLSFVLRDKVFYAEMRLITNESVWPYSVAFLVSRQRDNGEGASVGDRNNLIFSPTWKRGDAVTRVIHYNRLARPRKIIALGLFVYRGISVFCMNGFAKGATLYFRIRKVKATESRSCSLPPRLGIYKWQVIRDE